MSSKTVKFLVYKNTWKTQYRKGKSVGSILVPKSFHSGHIVDGLKEARVLPPGASANDVGLREMNGGSEWLAVHPCRRGYGAFYASKDECPRATVYYLVQHESDSNLAREVADLLK